MATYTNCRLAHTMVFTYLVLRTHILRTMLTAHNILLTQMYDKINWLRQPSWFIVSSPLDISDITSALFLGISGPSGSHVLGKIVKILTNFFKCVTSLPEKPETFQHLLLDLHLIRSKQLVNSLHVIAPVALPVLVALVSCAFLVLLFLCILWHVTIPDTSSSLLVHHCTRIQDWFFFWSLTAWVGFACWQWIDTNFQCVPPCSEVLPTSIWDSRLRCVHAWHIISRFLLLLVLLWSFDHRSLISRSHQ